MKPSLIVVGLGNPGSSHAATRHNAGFRALDALAAAFGEGEWTQRQKFAAETLDARILAAPVLLAKPQTFMNRSGEAVRKLVDFYKLDPAQQLLVLSDDADLSLGEVRLRRSGGPGTHNGLKSVVEQIGEGFPRIRIGLGSAPAGEDLANWVLSAPPEVEAAALEAAVSRIPEMVREFVVGSAEERGA